jgi:hypothetical protein
VTAREKAIAAALAGIDWRYPCLLWIADYLLDETGIDHAGALRTIEWNERRVMRQLRALAVQGQGECLVERAIDAFARHLGWEEAGECRQGAVMIGVYRDLAPNGSPAIFDGESRWICAALGGGMISATRLPHRVWEVKR